MSLRSTVTAGQNVLKPDKTTQGGRGARAGAVGWISDPPQTTMGQRGCTDMYIVGDNGGRRIRGFGFKEILIIHLFAITVRTVVLLLFRFCNAKGKQTSKLASTNVSINVSEHYSGAYTLVRCR